MLDAGEVFGLMLCAEGVISRRQCPENGSGSELWTLAIMHTVVLVADMDELFFE